MRLTFFRNSTPLEFKFLAYSDFDMYHLLFSMIGVLIFVESQGPCSCSEGSPAKNHSTCSQLQQMVAVLLEENLMHDVVGIYHYKTRNQ